MEVATNLSFWKWLIESRDVVFLKNTNLITLVNQINLLNDLDNQQISTKSDNENSDIIQIQNNKNKRKSHENQSSGIDVGDSGSKRSRRPSMLFQDHYALNTSLENLDNDPENFSESVNSID